ncbi:MAG: hypothetical protein PHC91_10965, partial [Eubacteriales bacterium]|nr:hypothetical protein [Eubacteriales bacterium]
STQPRILLELCIVKLALDQAGFTNRPAQTRPVEIKISESKPAEQKLAESCPADGIRQFEPKPAGSNLQESKTGEGIDPDRLWHMVFEEGETLKGSFNLLRVGTTLKEVNDSCFVVEASNEITMAYAMENASDLELIMERHIGKHLRMECCVSDGDSRQEKERTAEDLASEIGNKFGIHIDIQ